MMQKVAASNLQQNGQRPKEKSHTTKQKIVGLSFFFKLRKVKAVNERVLSTSIVSTV